MQIKTRVLSRSNAILKYYYDIFDKYVLVTRMGEQGNITKASQALLKKYGFNERDIIGCDFFSIFSTVDVKQSNMSFIAKHHEWEGQLLITCPNGGKFWLQSIVLRNVDYPKHYGDYIALHTDISDKKRIMQFSETDSLTSIPNRRKLNETIVDEINRSLRYNTPLVLAVMDIDHFKSINDDYGHTIGDEVLVNLSELVRNKIRQIDVFGRWGGEEFLLIMPMTNLDDVFRVCEKIRESIQNHSFDMVDTLHLSFCVTEFVEEDTPESLFMRADEALYEAKRKGRNQTRSKVGGKAFLMPSAR